MNIIGDVEGKSALLLDDMIDTAGTIMQGRKPASTKALVKSGPAARMVCCPGLLGTASAVRFDGSGGD